MRSCSKLGGGATVADSETWSKGPQETWNSYGPFGGHLFLDSFLQGGGGLYPLQRLRLMECTDVTVVSICSALKEQAWRPLFWQYKIKVFSLVLMVIPCSTRLSQNCIDLYFISNLSSMPWSSGTSRISGGSLGQKLLFARFLPKSASI